MRKRIIIILLLVLMAGSLLMPFYSFYPHRDLAPEAAAAFPGDVSGLALMLRGTNLLPVDLMPSLASVTFREGLLTIGVLLAVAGGLLAILKRRVAAYASVLFGAAGMLSLFLFVFYTQQLDGSMLYSVMLTSKWVVWLTFAVSLVLLVFEVLSLKGPDPLPVEDGKWRVISGILGLAALLMVLLPFASTYVPAGTFATPAEDALASRSVSGIQWMLGNEPMLKDIAAEKAAFADTTSGGAMSGLAMLSGSGRDIRNLFMIPTNNSSIRMIALSACALLLLGAVLSLVKKVDRWIPAGLMLVATVMLLTETVSTLAVDSSYQFRSATYQLMYLGLGGYTLVPLLMTGVSGASAFSAVLGIRRANEPYFVNPVPQRKRLRAVSMCLAAASVVLLLTPVYQVSLYAPGKVKNANPAVSRPVSGLELIMLRRPEELMNPVNTRGKALYTGEPAANGYTLGSVQSFVTGGLNRLALFAAAPMLFSLAALYLMTRPRRQKKAVVAVLLSGAALQAVTAAVSKGLIPDELGQISALGPLFISMGANVFSAFFAGFMDKEELPKKYKLFLMMLPFLVAVFLFSYMPLYGWSYSFYNFKFELPMNQQEFVGFKWFAELVTNPGHLSNIARVMSNTLAMSGLGIATGWMPMVFAILLNEISRTRFKKFVQIFTTLPNFISWTLVFSFALAMFAMDTGIYSKFMLNIGAISEPVAWLNSSENIWIKMWAWSTWKGLGWGSIMYLAAIAGIDQELYEAARVDGAGRFRQMVHITLPGLLPTFFVLLLLSISNIVNNGMEQYLVFQNSMNKNMIEVLDLYIYNITIASTSSNMYSFGTAIGILKTLFSVSLLFVANFASKMLRGESIV